MPCVSGLWMLYHGTSREPLLLMSLPAGSPFWQVALLFGAFVFLVFEAWRGWRAGFVRAVVNLCALVISGVLGVLAARGAGALFGGLDSPAGLIAGIGIGCVAAFLLFFLIWLAGALLFKRTDQQGGLFRILWGGGGALIGLVTGLMILWGGISLIRGLGALAEGAAATASKRSEPPPALAKGLVTMKESLELGHAGEVVKAVDPLPSDVYALIAQIAKVTNDQDAMARFLQYPGVDNVINSPRVANLLADPAVLAAAEKRDFVTLMTNKSLHEAIKDPQLAELVRQIDLREALNFALSPAQDGRFPKAHE